MALLQPLLQPVQGGVQVPEQIQPDAVEGGLSSGRRPDDERIPIPGRSDSYSYDTSPMHFN